MKALIAGGSGFVGGHMVKYLQAKNYDVTGVDIKRPEFDHSYDDIMFRADLRDSQDVQTLFSRSEFDEVYQLAANMGGMGHIALHHTEILHDNALININMIEAARNYGVKRYFFSSSVCAYRADQQSELNAVPHKEEDAYPANPQNAYGWEKIYAEQLCKYYRIDEFQTRVARYDNTYGPRGTWQGGREKAPAALCRKIAIAKMTGNYEIEVWGDGRQERTFMYIDDCIEGTYRLMQSNFPGPLNIGPNEVVTIDKIVYMIAEIAGIKITIKHIEGPQGARSRRSNNTKCKEILGWEPKICLYEGLEKTYPWIEEQVIKADYKKMGME